ncbi:hypothetical protein L484_009004 [Morus notabilis]|uniref:Uncharacterized protein n=1 Tax=Morus notabilis TaxID=981085 RepID=W9R3G0_9ROSA|nr:hypothetical protein L484_009004 [Morus notabilis]
MSSWLSSNLEMPIINIVAIGGISGLQGTSECPSYLFPVSMDLEQRGKNAYRCWCKQMTSFLREFVNGCGDPKTNVEKILNTHDDYAIFIAINNLCSEGSSLLQAVGVARIVVVAARSP